MNSTHKFTTTAAICVLCGIAICQGFLIAKNYIEIEHLRTRSDPRGSRVPDGPRTLDNATPPAPAAVSAKAAKGRNEARQYSDDFRERAIRTEAFQANLLEVMTGHLARRYDGLFKILPIDSIQQTKLREMLAQGLFSPELIPSMDHRKRATLEEANAYYVDRETRIRQLLGESNYRLYQNYKDGLPASNTAMDIAATLAGSGNPLNPQAHAFLQATLRHTAPTPQGAVFNTVAAVRAAASGSERAPITKECVEALKGWLTPAQYGAVVTMYNQENAL